MSFTLPKARCPCCENSLKTVGITKDGHTLYFCIGCNRRWSIREVSKDEA